MNPESTSNISQVPNSAGAQATPSITYSNNNTTPYSYYTSGDWAEYRPIPIGYKITIEPKESGYELIHTFSWGMRTYVFEKWETLLAFLAENELPIKKTIDFCENV